jgi:hypothetical protein
MKKYWGTLIIAVILMLILSSCGGRDLSTPSSRLVGHWVADTALKMEYYFSEIDSKTKEGTITEYDPNDGTVFTGKYTIFSEVPDGQKLTLDTTWPGGGDKVMDFMVKEDGTTAIMMDFRINYVDSKTKP